ncbi:hypothetical protein [Nocardioides piscis]|uniref:Uncharacterized protein n=1 Tax=Nocardioides piscis TaxID=2714938 RepID=A0A6G7YDK6_9ACTN|nr:hypothetical protein [Nocardioides piscis]QIK74902.1 hypothetical protein G7071_05130 [Nocardioides piscis]
MRIGRKKSMIDRAHDYVESVSDTVIPQLEAALESAREKAGPAITDARAKAGPALADARSKAAPVLAEGRALAAQKAAAGAALAAGTAATSRDFAASKVAELRHEPEPKGSKLKKFLLLSGLLAVGGAVFAKMKAKSAESDNWQSSYVPKPPPAPTSDSAAPTAQAPVTPAAPTSGSASGQQGDPLTDPISSLDPETPTANETADDVAGGAPGEALSDHAETPHQVTTPDSPATITDVDDVPKS